MITEEQASIELSNLSQKKDEDLYAYYCQIKTLLIRISEKDQVTYNRENTIIWNNIE